jgi:hypothetical protein
MIARAGRATIVIVDRRNPHRRRHRDQDLQLLCPAVAGAHFETVQLREPPEPRRFGLAILGTEGIWIAMATAWAANEVPDRAVREFPAASRRNNILWSIPKLSLATPDPRSGQQNPTRVKPANAVPQQCHRDVTNTAPQSGPVD